jgi:hypothetical protein
MLNICVNLLLLLSIISCAKTSQEQIEDAIELANEYLTRDECNDAIDVLEEVGLDNDNGDFVSVYSAAYACKSGFSMLDLFSADLSSIDSTSIISSLAGLSTSDESTADSVSFLAMQNAINIILESQVTSSNASALKRISEFGTSKGADLNFQALFMILVQTGKYYQLYGDADGAGVKGAGGNNSCLYSYTNADAVVAIGATTPGSCVAATGNEGSSFLEAPVLTTTIKTRMCYGLILLNNMMDILANLSLTSGNYGDISNIKTVVDALYTGLIISEAGSFGTTVILDVKEIRSQTTCMALQFDEVERYYAFFLENLYQ